MKPTHQVSFRSVDSFSVQLFFITFDDEFISVFYIFTFMHHLNTVAAVYIMMNDRNGPTEMAHNCLEKSLVALTYVKIELGICHLL